MTASAVQVDMHRVGEAVPWVVADRNLVHLASRVEIAADDPQDWRALVDAQSTGGLSIGSNRLDVLSDAADSDAGQLLNLAKQGARREVEFIDELPRSSVMKILRRELRDMELAKRGTS